MKFFSNILLLVAIIFFCTSCQDNEIIEQHEIEIQELNQLLIEYENQNALLEVKIKSINDEYKINLELKQEELDRYVGIISDLESENKILSNKFDEISGKHHYFVSNVQGYVQENADNQFVGEAINVDDEVLNFIVTEIKNYKGTEVVTFEGEATLTGMISIYETYDGPNIVFEPDRDSLNRLPRFFEVGIGVVRISNGETYIDEIRKYEDQIITISVQSLAIGNFPPGWANSVILKEIIG